MRLRLVNAENIAEKAKCPSQRAHAQQCSLMRQFFLALDRL